jgi:hypothetical protein
VPNMADTGGCNVSEVIEEVRDYYGNHYSD